MNRILKQTMVTFSHNHSRGLVHLNNDQKFTQNVAEILRLTSCITSQDVFFEPHPILNRGGKAPVTYIDLFENSTASVGIFVLKRDAYTMPLHDHPSMYGFIKVIFGKIRVRSYTEMMVSLPRNLFEVSSERGRRVIGVEMAEEFEANPDSPAVMLTPKEGNYHSITSVDGPAAFLDLLSPPYDYRTGQRICHYYSEITPPSTLGEDGDNPSNRYLIEVDEPTHFQCDSFPYSGPPLFVSHL